MKDAVYTNETIEMLERELREARRQLKCATRKYNANLKTKSIYNPLEAKFFNVISSSIKIDMLGYHVEKMRDLDEGYTIYRKDPNLLYNEMKSAEYRVNGLQEMIEVSF